MRRQPGGAQRFVVAAALMGCAGAAAAMHLHARRMSPNDLEVSGMVRGLAPGASRFLPRAELLRLPRVAATISDDADYPGVTMHVIGVELGVLAEALGVSRQADLIDALCTDGYRSYYPREAVETHRPLLVLQVDGVAPSGWAAKMRQEDPGPYFIVYRHFEPAFRVLAHVDRPQLPTNVVRVHFGTAKQAFTQLAPRGVFAEDSPQQQGFAIARQNCIRCHAEGETGGSKSPRSWAALGGIARDRAAYFGSYISDPRTINPKATMPANPEYDPVTIDALTAYFRTFAEAPVRAPLEVR